MFANRDLSKLCPINLGHFTRHKMEIEKCFLFLRTILSAESPNGINGTLVTTLLEHAVQPCRPDSWVLLESGFQQRKPWIKQRCFFSRTRIFLPQLSINVTLHRRVVDPQFFGNAADFPAVANKTRDLHSFFL